MQTQPMAKVAGKGKKSYHMRAIYCHFPQEMFDTIRKMAVENNSSFSEQVRTIIEWGLETIDDERCRD